MFDRGAGVDQAKWEGKVMPTRQREGEENGGLLQQRLVSRKGGQSAQNGGCQQSFLKSKLRVYLPQGVPIQQIRRQLKFAYNFLRRIKNRFADGPLWQVFYEILILYQRGYMNSNEVFHEVALLFVNHNDLLLEFPFKLPLMEIFPKKGVTRVHLAPFSAYGNARVSSLQEIFVRRDGKTTVKRYDEWPDYCNDVRRINGATSVHDEFLAGDNDD